MTATVAEKSQFLDKEALKIAFLDLLKTDKAFAFEISQIFSEKNIQEAPIRKTISNEELIKGVREDFAKYEETFKILA
jgi:hypothetical protein